MRVRRELRRQAVEIDTVSSFAIVFAQRSSLAPILSRSLIALAARAQDAGAQCWPRLGVKLRPHSPIHLLQRRRLVGAGPTRCIHDDGRNFIARESQLSGRIKHTRQVATRSRLCLTLSARCTFDVCPGGFGVASCTERLLHAEPNTARGKSSALQSRCAVEPDGKITAFHRFLNGGLLSGCRQIHNRLTHPREALLKIIPHASVGASVIEWWRARQTWRRFSRTGCNEDQKQNAEAPHTPRPPNKDKPQCMDRILRYQPP